jgi:hypothetical protein
MKKLHIKMTYAEVVTGLTMVHGQLVMVKVVACVLVSLWSSG